MSEGTQPVRGKRTLVWIILGILVVFSGMYVWKEISLALLGRSAAKEHEELEVQQTEREEALRNAFSARSAELLEFAALPLGWAVRAEAIDQDHAQIEEYMVHLVKQPMVQRLVFVTPDGTIKIATDKKLQGEPATRFFGKLTAGEKITLETDDSGNLQLLVPILGYNTKLGTLIVTLDKNATEL